MRKIVITGCSSGGTSTLINALKECGHAIVEEPGRRVIAAERASGGDGFPWEDIHRFSDLAFWMAVGDHAAATAELTFFDRSALDQAAWYARQGSTLPGDVPRYDSLVFLAPPWPEIYVTDMLINGVQVVSMDDVPMMLGSVSFQSNDVRGAQYSLVLLLLSRASFLT